MTIHPDRATDYLRHIVEAIDRATAYARKAQDFSSFEQDVLLQDGVIRNIGVIGEAAIKIAQVEPDIATKWPHLPWRKMQIMRHKLVMIISISIYRSFGTQCSRICRNSVFKSGSSWQAFKPINSITL
jgi:uncharacterized protein with HEPN domain